MRLWIPNIENGARCAMFDLNITFNLWEDGQSGWSVSTTDGRYAAQGDTPAEALEAFATIIVQTRALGKELMSKDPFFPTDVDIETVVNGLPPAGDPRKPCLSCGKLIFSVFSHAFTCKGNHNG